MYAPNNLGPFQAPPSVHSGSEGEAMLILTRRVGEKVMIGDNVAVIVLGVKGRSVRIGVNAPKSIPVHRKEIYERIQRDIGPAHKIQQA